MDNSQNQQPSQESKLSQLFSQAAVASDRGSYGHPPNVPPSQPVNIQPPLSNQPFYNQGNPQGAVQYPNQPINPQGEQFGQAIYSQGPGVQFTSPNLGQPAGPGSPAPSVIVNAPQVNAPQVETHSFGEQIKDPLPKYTPVKGRYDVISLIRAEYISKDSHYSPHFRSYIESLGELTTQYYGSPRTRVGFIILRYTVIGSNYHPMTDDYCLEAIVIGKTQAQKFQNLVTYWDPSKKSFVPRWNDIVVTHDKGGYASPDFQQSLLPENNSAYWLKWSEQKRNDIIREVNDKWRYVTDLVARHYSPEAFVNFLRNQSQQPQFGQAGSPQNNFGGFNPNSNPNQNFSNQGNSFPGNMTPQGVPGHGPVPYH